MAQSVRLPHAQDMRRASQPYRFPAGFHEHERLRSRFVRHLIRDAAGGSCTPRTIHSTIPKVLVRFWDDAEAVPADVGECLACWEGLRARGFQVLTFHDASAMAYIRETFGSRQVEAFDRCTHPAMRSDYFRLCYLVASGDFYVDADDVMTGGRWRMLYDDDCLKVHPLCYSITKQCLTSMKEAWVNDQSARSHTFYVNNNPLSAPAGHPVLVRALERATAALLATGGARDIQSMTGPGNLTAALVAHARELALAGRPRDFVLMRDWDQVAETRWDLSYRADQRNWRNAEGWR